MLPHGSIWFYFLVALPILSLVYFVGVLTSKPAIRAVDSILNWFEGLEQSGQRFLGLEARLATASVRRTLGGVAHYKPHHMTEIEWAVRLPDNWPEPGSTATPKLYDFAMEEQILRREGTYAWLRIPPEYLPESLVQPFGDEILGQYLDDAHRFLARRVELHAGEHNLYEDEEGAVIVSMFRRSDRRCFYVIDQLRRVIGNNALKLIYRQQLALWLMFALCATPIFYTHWRFQSAGGSITALGSSLLNVIQSPFGYVIAAAWVIALSAVFIWFLNMQKFYATQQQHNMRELSDFLTRYLSLINNRFREANARASRVVQADERDSKKMGQDASNLHLITIWLAFRPFFIEAFVRNVYFQIRRNLGYWQIFAYALGVIFSLTAWVVFVQVLFHVPMLSRVSYVVALAALLMGWLSIIQVHKKVVLMELNQTNWLGYDHLEVGKQLGEVIGKYAEDIGQRKNSNRGYEQGRPN